MLDLRHLIRDLIEQDVLIQSLVGGSNTDKRLYWYYPSLVVPISATQPGYMTYNQITFPDEQTGVGEPVYMLNVWTKDIGVATLIHDRLRAIFNGRDYVTEENRKVHSKILFSADTFQQQPNYAGMSLHLKLGYCNIVTILPIVVNESIHPAENVTGTIH